MIYFYIPGTVPATYQSVLDNMKITRNWIPEDDDVFMIASMSESLEHMIKVRGWILEHSPHAPMYVNALVSVAILKQNVASLLRLSLPLS